MKKLSRRTLLKIAGGTAAGVVGGVLPFSARADGVWGDLPANTLTPSPNFGVLHIHLLGGMAPFESFYYRDVVGVRTRGFDTEVTNVIWNGVCSNTPVGLEHTPVVFGMDTAAVPKAIHLGPWAKPLWSRTDIRDRMRVIVQSHNLIPHEAAIPFALTGLRLGNPKQANLGAAIAHRYWALDVDANTPRTLPYAYGLVDETSTDLDVLTASMSSVGAHPGAAKPLVLKIGPGFGTLINQLQRANMTAAKDALLDQYRGQYRDWLRKNNAVTRSRAFSDYDTGLSSLLNAANLNSFLSSVSTTIPSDSECARETTTSFQTQANSTKTMLQAAAYLMTQPAQTRARYVCVIDRGLEKLFGLPYDVHFNNIGGASNHPSNTSTNLWNVLTSLASIINAPMEADPNKLNLGDTLILITTEFGRTPFKSLGDQVNAGSLGRDHWPQAFANVLIGGPITNRGVVGSISDTSNMGGIADVAYSPTDVHAAAILSGGIDPFADESFAIGQLTGSLGGIDHAAAIQNMKTTLLGL